MRNRIRRKIGFLLVIAMLFVLVYPGESGYASEDSEGFIIADNVLTSYIGSENAVTIPDGVIAIGDGAFQGTTISSVSIPSSVTSIGNYAFASCAYLTDVEISSSVTSVGTAAFAGCTSLGSVVWDSGASILDSVFSGCSGLSSITISDSVAEIGSEAFANCSNLTSITIPASANTVSSTAFDGCISLTSINVSEGNAFYASYDGVLYTIGYVSLVRCPQGKTSIAIHENTQSIEAHAFYGCYLSEVSLPSSVTTVMTNAFTGSEVQTLILQESVSYFGEQAFTVHSIVVPGTAPVAAQLVEEYGEIVVTDYVADTGSTGTQSTEEQQSESQDNTGTSEPDTSGTQTATESTDTLVQEEQMSPSAEHPTDQEASVPLSDMEDLNLEGEQRQEIDNSYSQSMDTDAGSQGDAGSDQDASGTAAENSSGNTGGNVSGNAAGTASGSSASGSSSSGSTASTAIAEGTPYLAADTDVRGWDQINDAMEAGDDEGTYQVVMNGTTVVPAEALTIVHDKKLTIVLDMGNYITWTLQGEDIAKDSIKDTDFGVTLGTDYVPEELQSDVAEDSYSVQLSLAYDGVFGFTAVLKISFGNLAAGYDATLYYYNEDGNKMEYIDKEQINGSGDVSFSFAHASDYVIVIEGLSAEDGEIALLGTHIKDNTPKTGPGLNAKYILCLGIMLLGVYLVLSSKKEPVRKIA